ncbi:hypothetical protein X997_5509 [Burkholderia pseudomallei A79C]|nr:hypothetical protein X997_5509 [Burkholderia pseudomallei A79C]
MADDFAVATGGRTAGPLQNGTARPPRPVCRIGRRLGSHLLPIALGQVSSPLWGHPMGVDRSARRGRDHRRLHRAAT